MGSEHTIMNFSSNLLYFLVRKNVEIFDGIKWKRLKDFPLALIGGAKVTFIPGNDNVVYIAGGRVKHGGYSTMFLLNKIWEFNLQTNDIKELSYKIPVGNYKMNIRYRYVYLFRF